MRSWLEVDFKALKNNYEVVKNLVGKKEILGVVKSNAYGSGIVEVANQLISYGVKILGVACLQEAIVLRKAGIKSEILILGLILRDEYEIAFDNDIQLTISSYEDLDFIEKNNFKNPKVQIKIDTGMGRIGFMPDNKIIDFIKNKSQLKKVSIVGVFTHFSSADISAEDEFTKSQIKKFDPFEKLLDIKYIHSQNSDGILRFNSLCNTNLVRPGIILYGYINYPNILPVSILKSKIIYLKKLEADTFISYGKKGLAKKGDLVATIAIGYGDGLPRNFSNIGKMDVLGVPCKIVGNICMDSTMIIIDEKICGKVKVGMTVEVISRENMFEIFKEAGVFTYEYLTGLSNRVERVYI
ncbi:MAG: alanine racemase [Fusobacteriaceae bacterium]